MTLEITPSIILYLASAITFIVLLGLVWLRFDKWLRRRRLRGIDQKSIAHRWRDIEIMFGSESEAARKLAVLEADKLLDEILKGLRLPGDTMGERLKVAGYKYEGVRAAWTGHKIRNRLVHESTFNLSPRLAQEALQSFRNTLKSLGIL